MFSFSYLRRTLIECRTAIDSKLSSLHCYRTRAAKSKEQESVIVSYLVDSCGLSREKAISASKFVTFGSTERANSVLALLRSHGFGETDIEKLISKHPALIMADPEKNLKPKIAYVESLGILAPDLPKVLCANTQILLRNLNTHVIPTFDFLRGFLETSEDLVYALKQSTRVIRCNAEEIMMPNIDTLLANGVSKSLVGRLIMLKPQSLMWRADLFSEMINEIKGMGFEPKTKKFVLAVRSMATVSKATWERKKELLMSFGWSENVFSTAFKVQPMLMLCSESKIKELMDFSMKAGLQPSDISKCPNLFLASLERRIMPRYFVLKTLISEGLIRKDVDLVWPLNASKTSFEKKFIAEFEKDVPQLIKAYRGECKFEGFSQFFESKLS